MLICSPRKEKPLGWMLWSGFEDSVMVTVPSTGVMTVVLTGSATLALPSPVAVETVSPAATCRLTLSRETGCQLGKESLAGLLVILTCWVPSALIVYISLFWSRVL